jgi:hypothetical protein
MYGFIADLHLMRLPEKDYMQSLNMFLGLIKEHKEPCKGIFVLGDLFDHKLNVEEARTASLFIANLVCNGVGFDNTNAPVYFIHGTYSHDLDQYKMFIPLLNKIPDARYYYFDHVTVHTRIGGPKILIIPHESGDIDYTPYLEDTYDMILGHGVLTNELLNPCRANTGIIHSATKFGEISKLCVFGHYHGLTNFGNNVWYAGPWLRWKYGEDTERVFFFCDDNFKVFTRKNPFAMEYKTIEIHNPEELREIVSQDIQTPHRFKIEATPEDIDIYRGIILSTKQNQHIKYQLSETITTEIGEEENDKSDTPTEQTDNVSRPIDSLIEYIFGKYDKDLSKQIHEYEVQIKRE